MPKEKKKLQTCERSWRKTALRARGGAVSAEWEKLEKVRTSVFRRTFQKKAQNFSKEPNNSPSGRNKRKKNKEKEHDYSQEHRIKRYTN